jgi:hypothetical protein
MSSVAPIRPEEVADAKSAQLPAAVIEVFNDLITTNWSGDRATVKQEKALVMIAERLGITRQEVFDRKLLDVEHAYIKAGWKVRYDKPGWDESYEAYFVFQR